MQALTDIVLIHAYQRVEFLYPQVTAFIEEQGSFDCSCGGHRVLFVVVDDSADPQTELAFEREVSLIRSYISDKGLDPGWGIDYWSKGRQLGLVSAVSGAGERKFFEDSESKKLGGVRAVQNISLLIAEHLAGTAADANLLVHKLDDDIFPFFLRFVGEGRYAVFPVGGFFCRKRKALARDATRIVASYYTFDGPSIITDLFEMVEAVHTLFLHIKPANVAGNSFPWELVADRLYVYGAPRTVDCSALPEEIRRLLNPGHLSETRSLDNLLRQVSSGLSLFDSGVNRFEYNLDNYAADRGWEGKQSFPPGGCVSFRLRDRFMPVPSFGDQDLLWGYCEQIRRGGVKGDFSVLHIKTGSARQGFSDTVLKGREVDVRCSFPMTVKAQEFISGIFGVPFESGDFLDFGGFGRGIVGETEARLKKIISIIDFKLLNGGGAADRIREEALAIRGRLAVILDGYSVVTERYGSIVSELAPEDIERRCKEWLAGEEPWRLLRKKAGELKERF